MNVDAQVKRIDLISDELVDAIVSISFGGVDLLGLLFVGGAMANLPFPKQPDGSQIVLNERPGAIDRIAAAAYEDAIRRNDPPIFVHIRRPTDVERLPSAPEPDDVLVAVADGVCGGKEFRGVRLFENRFGLEIDEPGLQWSFEELVHIEVAVRHVYRNRYSRGDLRLVWSRSD